MAFLEMQIALAWDVAIKAINKNSCCWRVRTLTSTHTLIDVEVGA